MAQVLMEIPSDDFSVEDILTNPREVYLRLHRRARMDIESEMTDPEAYVPDADDYDDCIIGAIEPERLKKAVIKWNPSIGQALLRAIEKFLDTRNKDYGQVALQLDTETTYELKKAAIAADNNFFDYADHFVALPNENGFTYLQTVIQDRDFAKIMAAPEKYAIIEIQVK